MAQGPFTGQGTDTAGITLAFRRVIHPPAGGSAPVRQERFLTPPHLCKREKFKKSLRLQGRKDPGISTTVPVRERLSTTGSFRCPVKVEKPGRQPGKKAFSTGRPVRQNAVPLPRAGLLRRVFFCIIEAGNTGRRQAAWIRKDYNFFPKRSHFFPKTQFILHYQGWYNTKKIQHIFGGV